MRVEHEYHLVPPSGGPDVLIVTSLPEIVSNDDPNLYVFFFYRFYRGRLRVMRLNSGAWFNAALSSLRDKDDPWKRVTIACCYEFSSGLTTWKPWQRNHRSVNSSIHHIRRLTLFFVLLLMPIRSYPGRSKSFRFLSLYIRPCPKHSSERNFIWGHFYFSIYSFLVRKIYSL